MEKRTYFWICGPTQCPSRRIRLLRQGRHYPDTEMLGVHQGSQQRCPVDPLRIHGYFVAVARMRFAMESGEVGERGAVAKMGDRGGQRG